MFWYLILCYSYIYIYIFIVRPSIHYSRFYVTLVCYIFWLCGGDGVGWSGLGSPKQYETQCRLSTHTQHMLCKYIIYIFVFFLMVEWIKVFLHDENLFFMIFPEKYFENNFEVSNVVQRCAWNKYVLIQNFQKSGKCLKRC